MVCGNKALFVTCANALFLGLAGSGTTDRKDSRSAKLHGLDWGHEVTADSMFQAMFFREYRE
ncbi:hypothetical protein OF385_11105 [Glutamicibacter sp. JL.03c]|uniref:hypothetical protein n=1 Tax=Glutamicibacter sp. JL.03c TaxID=2984842 RepID=UPI0021F74635|nr:hypothetical protein [Glutamicibacter sp. JL.03c]UYQ76579.1 hypothetical protein OF385_11105 [Glutamicibacter sp. JL.03c]